jgi:hypothetical protein
MAVALLGTLGHAPDCRREFFTETVENFVENSEPTTETPHESSEPSDLHQDGASAPAKPAHYIRERT